MWAAMWFSKKTFVFVYLTFWGDDIIPPCCGWCRVKPLRGFCRSQGDRQLSERNTEQLCPPSAFSSSLSLGPYFVRSPSRSSCVNCVSGHVEGPANNKPVRSHSSPGAGMFFPFSFGEVWSNSASHYHVFLLISLKNNSKS